jgi:hypothetical protein
MRPYTDVENESPPHVILTSDVDWDSRDPVGQTFLMKEDDDELCCRTCIIEVLDDHEKIVADNPVLKKFKCLVGEDEFEEIIS